MWPEPKPISQCESAIGEWVLCYLFVPQSNDGGWFVCCKATGGRWLTDYGEPCVPRFFVSLPPKIDGLSPLPAAHTLN
jgi:hypothetical protein